MSRVKVWNDNVLDHVEKFKGKEIKIASKGYVEMDRDDAVLFKSQFYPPKFDKGNVQMVESFKMIRIEAITNKPGASTVEPDDFVCMKCGFKAASNAGLKSHIRANHADSMVDDDARKELIEKG